MLATLGVYLPPIYMYCIGFTNDTDLVYWYARHLCLIDWGGSVCLLYICIVLDLQMTLIWCTGMQGIYA